MKKFTLSVLLLTLSFVLIFNLSRKEKDADVITIGSVLSLTGPAQYESETLKSGINFAINEYKNSGIDVLVEYADDATDAKKAVSAVTYLQTKGVDSIVGFDWDFIYNSIGPILDQQKIVGITATNSREYTSPAKYGFHTAPRTSASQHLIEEWLIKTLEQAAKNTNTTIVSADFIPFSNESDSLKTILPTISTKNPDAIFVILGGDQVLASFFGGLNQFKLEIPILAGTTAISGFLNQNPQYTKSGYPVTSIIPKSPDKFIQKYKEKNNGEIPGDYTYNAYIATKILIDAHKDKKKEETIYDSIIRLKFFNQNNELDSSQWHLIEN
jgi:ABC-type branched-subunit amino acid transport system substrate-binding protein